MRKTIIIMILSGFVAALAAGPMEENMKPFPAWSSFLGCSKACADYLGLDHSAGQVWGATGYGFLLNIFPGVCPSGPTAFDNGFLLHNARSLGLEFEGYYGHSADPEFKTLQREALNFVKRALAENKPVFGWELDIPEYYLIVGADEDGYRFLDFDGSVKSCPVDRPGTSDIGMLEFLTVSRGDSLDHLSRFKSALQFLREYHSAPQGYALPNYTQGLAAYDVWIESMKSPDANHWGVAYNAQVWAEARSRALEFLIEARELPSVKESPELLELAIVQFTAVSGALKDLAAMYPMPPRGDEFTPENSEKAVGFLLKARDAERRGVDCLLQLAAGL